MFGLWQRYQDGRKIKKAKALMDAEPDRIQVTPENVLILWEGLRSLRIPERQLISYFPLRSSFHSVLSVCVKDLQSSTELAKVHEQPERRFYPPEPEEYSLRDWCTTLKPSGTIDAIDNLLALDKALREHAEYMELSKEYDAEHFYEFRIEQVYYVYCDIMTFVEVIFRKHLQ